MLSDKDLEELLVKRDAKKAEIAALKASFKGAVPTPAQVQVINRLKEERKTINRRIFGASVYRKYRRKPCPCCGEMKAKQYFKRVVDGEPDVCRQCALLVLGDAKAGGGHE